MATNNSVNTSLSGQTGTGNFVGATSPTLVTPALGTPSSGVITNCTGAPTLTSIAFSSTTGVVGTTTNNNAAAGSVGEFSSSVIAFGSAHAISATVATDLTSLSLTAGDWDIWVSVFFSAGTAASGCFAGISQTSATLPDNSLLGQGTMSTTPTCSAFAQQRVSLASTTTVYCVVFTSANANASGGIYARRVR